jgi:hypothetical protein
MTDIISETATNNTWVPDCDPPPTSLSRSESTAAVAGTPICVALGFIQVFGLNKFGVGSRMRLGVENTDNSGSSDIA